MLPAPLSPWMLTWLHAVTGLFITKSPHSWFSPKPLEKDSHYILKSRGLLSSLFVLRFWHILELCVMVCFVLYFWQGLLFCSLGWPGIYCLAQAILSCMVILVPWPPKQWVHRHEPLGLAYILRCSPLQENAFISWYYCIFHWNKLLSFCLWEFFQLSMFCLFSLSDTKRCSCLLSTLFILFWIFSVLGNPGSFCWVTQLECKILY